MHTTCGVLALVFNSEARFRNLGTTSEYAMQNVSVVLQEETKHSFRFQGLQDHTMSIFIAGQLE